MGLLSARVEITFHRERAALEALVRLFRRATAHDESRAADYLAALSKAFGPLPDSAAGGSRTPLVATLVLDAGALMELARGNVRVRAIVARAVGSRARILVPATSLTDPAAAAIAPFVAAIVPVDAPLAARAGTYMARARSARPLEAFAVACAAGAAPAALVTADPVVAGALARAADQDAVLIFGV